MCFLKETSPSERNYPSSSSVIGEFEARCKVYWLQILFQVVKASNPIFSDEFPGEALFRLFLFYQRSSESDPHS
jgi:hypothetical protein